MKTMPVLLQRTLNPTAALFAAILISAFSFQLSAFSQPSTFSYQGRLDTSGQPTTGLYDMSFTLYDAYTVGNTVGAPVNAYATPVTNGLFTALLDFGTGAFDGNPRFLQIAVRPTGSTNALVALAPRQFLSSTPYAIQAATASALHGTLADSQLSANIPRLNGTNTFTGTVNLNPSTGAPFTTTSTKKIANLNADLLDGLDSTSFWKTSGNLGTGPSTNFLGTLDNQPLDFRVNGLSTMRLDTSGNLGIGTSSPGGKLHLVNGDGNYDWILADNYSTGGYYPIVDLRTSKNNTPGSLTTTTHGMTLGTFRISGVTASNNYRDMGGIIGIQNGTAGAGWVPGDLRLYTATATGRNDDQLVLSTSGNVGIGTTSPDKRLHVSYDSPLTPAVKLGAATDAEGAYTFIGNDPSSTTTSYIGNAYNHDSASFQIRMKGTDQAKARLTVLGGGNVGIGTATPSERLEVNGRMVLSYPTNPGRGLFLQSGAYPSDYSWLIAGSQNVAAGLEFTPSTAVGGATFTTPVVTMMENGNVGIGTVNPAAQLEAVTGNRKVALNWPSYGVPWGGLLSLSRPSDGSPAFFIGGAASPPSTVDDMVLYAQGGGVEMRFASQDQGFGFYKVADIDVAFSSNRPPPLVKITGAGNLGIGTTSPGYPLTVRRASGTGDMVSWGNDSQELGRLGYSANTNGGWIGLNRPTGDYGVWLDAAGTTFFSGGNVGIGTTSPSAKLEVAGEAKATVFTPTSDRNAKENFAPVDGKSVLDKVSALPISRWSFKELPGAEHIGPMAQDFYAAFGVGPDDKHIATVDADGVALAAIQGLNEKVESGKQKAETRIECLEQRLEQKETEITELKARLADLEKLVSAIADKGASQ